MIDAVFSWVNWVFAFLNFGAAIGSAIQLDFGWFVSHALVFFLCLFASLHAWKERTSP